MNIYCFSTLSFAKLQFKSVINKAFHKHGVASFTDAWIETRISKMKTGVNQPDSYFVFNEKDYPDAEIIDLR